MSRERDSLDEIFISAIKATVAEDRLRGNTSLLSVIVEGKTFYERVFCNFLIMASGYYDKEELTEWIEAF